MSRVYLLHRGHLEITSIVAPLPKDALWASYAIQRSAWKAFSAKLDFRFTGFSRKLNANWVDRSPSYAAADPRPNMVANLACLARGRCLKSARDKH